LVATEIPIADSAQVFCFQELARRHGDYAVAGLAAIAQKHGNVLTQCKFIFFSVGATPLMAAKAQTLIDGKNLNGQLIVDAIKVVREEIEVIADLTNSADAKQHLVGVLLERALKQMIS